MPETIEHPEVAPVPRVLPLPPPPKKGAKPDPNAAVVGPDGLVLLRPRTLEHDRELVFAQFSPCGKFLFAGSYDGRVYRWKLNAEGDDAITVFEGHGGWMQGLSFHPDGKQIYTGDSWGQLICWNYADADPKPVWKRQDCHSRWMRSIALSADGERLATCGADRVVRLWSSLDGRPTADLATLPNDLMCVHFSPSQGANGNALLVGDLKGVIHQFDAFTQRRVGSFDASVLYARPTVQGFKEINDVGGVRCMASDFDGGYLFAGGTQPATSGFLTGKPTVLCFDFATRKIEHTWQWDKVEPADGIVMGLEWCAGGYVLAASSGQPGRGALAGWKPGEEAPVYLNKLLPHGRTISLHPEGNRLALVQVLIRQGAGAGNGRRLSKDGEYLGLISHVKVFETAA